MTDDLERKQLISALKKLLKTYDNLVRSEYEGTVLLESQLDIVNFARRVLTRAEKASKS